MSSPFARQPTTCGFSDIGPGAVREARPAQPQSRPAPAARPEPESKPAPQPRERARLNQARKNHTLIDSYNRFQVGSRPRGVFFFGAQS
jgi:hypothetical protein